MECLTHPVHNGHYTIYPPAPWKITRVYRIRKKWFVFWGPINHKTYTKHEIPPYIKEKCTETSNTICIKCLLKMELKALRGYPLEDLPLLINIHWFTEEGKTLFKQRLSS